MTTNPATETPAMPCEPAPIGAKTRWAWSWPWLIATFFGAGLGKPGPGTWGSVATVLLWSAAAWGLRLGPYALLWLTLAGILLSVGFGVPAASLVARESGREDPGFVVIDEVAGQLITLIGAVLPELRNPERFRHFPDWRWVPAALVLFRLFDITKPFPVRRLERLPGGWGIVFDDVAAGLYAWGALEILRHWL